MEKRPGIPKPGKDPPQRPKSPDDVEATEIGGDNLLAPANTSEGEPAAPPADDAFTLQDEDTAGQAAEAPPSDKPARTVPNLAATVAHEPEAAEKDKRQSAAKQPAPAAPAPTKDASKVNLLGDFRLLKKLGAGGMGAVYKAHQISLDREVAVKILSKELAAKPAFVQRFVREARVMARLDHPNILRCYEVKESHGYHYIAMEFVSGGSIDGWLKKLSRFGLGDALHVTIACARGLGHAHEQGLVHRDVKPDNVLLTGKGVVKVADLGLAKAQDDDLSLTKTGTGAGTPIFMAPEQARDAKHVDGRSDVYALGCMLYCLLTGEAPFKGETLVELIEAKEKGKFKSARLLNNEVPERLDLILDKMLARKPEHRYQNCTEVADELEALGLANDQLSFIEAPAATTKTTARPVARTAPKASVPTKAPAAAKKPAPEPEEEETPGELWFATFKNAQGKQATKKMTEEEVLGAIKSGSFGPDTQVSRTLKGGYRALATWSEFEPTLRARMTKAVADKKGQKYRSMYEQIEKEDKRRRRWRWLHNLLLKTGGLVGLLLWLAIIAGVCIGGYFLVRYGIDYLGEKVAK